MRHASLNPYPVSDLTLKSIPYSHFIINKLVAEVFIMRSNSPVSAHAYCGVDALRSWSIYFIALPETWSF